MEEVSKNFIETFIDEDLAPGGRCEGMKVHTRFPVSYTHLDVYKRQVEHEDDIRGVLHDIGRGGEGEGHFKSIAAAYRLSLIHICSQTGEVSVNEEIEYSDDEQNEVKFPDPKIYVDLSLIHI